MAGGTGARLLLRRLSETRLFQCISDMGRTGGPSIFEWSDFAFDHLVAGYDTFKSDLFDLPSEQAGPSTTDWATSTLLWTS